nr:ergothioneine biosynthesis protein EgtB [Variovorax sp. Sphag1AA]
MIRSARRNYAEVRTHSLALTRSLTSEDQSVQSMPDASPTKWHLGHTTWFFETLLLAPHVPGYAPFDARMAYLFNSYYESLGPRLARPERGMLTRPALEHVLAYRQHVDAAVDNLLSTMDAAVAPTVLDALALGLHHEQQHQELLVTDIVHAFSRNPLFPAFAPPSGLLEIPRNSSGGAEWLSHPGGIVDVGHDGPGFAFDNERPRHPTLLRPFAIADRLVTNREYLAFIDDDGYRRSDFWLSDGWAAIHANGWEAPGYWMRAETLALRPSELPDEGWLSFGHDGLHALDFDDAVTHLSFYEAAAYAQWAGARLPTEFEWEAASTLPGMRQVADRAWQWTRSSYDPYPGFRPLAGAASEYNGKFMVGQLVLRGGSIATPPGHARNSYRNFFPPATRWQITGMRLARDA